MFMMISNGAIKIVARKRRTGLVNDLAFSILCSLVILAAALLALLAMLEQAAVRLL
jgi:hypothetical protein